MSKRLLVLASILICAPVARAHLPCAALLTEEQIYGNEQAFGEVLYKMIDPTDRLTVRLDWIPAGETLPKTSRLDGHRTATHEEVPEIEAARFVEGPTLHVQVVRSDEDGITRRRHYQFSANDRTQRHPTGSVVASHRGGARAYLTFETEFDVVPDRAKMLAVYLAMTAAPWAKAVRLWVELDPANAPTASRGRSLEALLTRMRDLHYDERQALSDIALEIRPNLVDGLDAEAALKGHDQAFLFPKRWRNAGVDPELKDADHVYLEYWFHNPYSRVDALGPALKRVRE